MTYTYNLAGMRTSELDPESAALGLTWSMRYTYDALGRLILTENIEGTIARTEYDLAGNIVRQTVRENASAPEQTILTATYDFAGNVLTQTDANGYTVTNTYNALNQLRSTTMPGDASIPLVTATNQYNRSALVSTSWSTAGVLQTYTYDNLGHLLSLSKSEADGDRAITKYFRYDNNGNLVYGTDGNGNVTVYTYDAMNRVIFVSQGGKTTGTTYDANGNQLTATDWLGNTTTKVFDPLNRLSEKRDANDLPQETYFYDESSRQIAAEDVYGRRTTYEYDRNNRLILTTAPDGYTIAQTYDRRGNVVTQTDALGNTTHYAYDYLGRLVSVTDALDQATTYTYDLKGNLLSQTDAAGNTTYLEYNCRDLLLRKVSPGGRTGEPGAYIYDPTAVISYTYDALGNTATRTDRNGNTTDFEWDVHGNLLSQAIGTTEISYTYDSNGNVLQMTDSLGTTTRVYDEFNRCVEKTVPIIGTSNYAYDLTASLPAGHVAETTTDSHGNTTLREYDRTGRLIRVTDTAADLTTHTVQYIYNDNGSVASVLYPDGAREDYTYTDGNLLETLTNTLSDGTVLETYVYTYDISRNLLTKQDAKGTTAYTYDPLGRVLTVTEPSGKLTEYTYDGAGNRSTQTVTETVEGGAISIVRTTYTYDVRNRLIQLQKHDISDAALDPILLEITDYTYDHSGNQLLTTRTTYTDGVAGTPVMLQSNTYDVWNQLVRTETENGTVVENAYNGDGRRVIKTVNGAATYYLYEYNKVILETNVYGDVTGRNVYGLNLLIRTVGVDTFYYMYNGHADVTALLTPSGDVAASYYYDAFGNILEQTGDVSNSVLFAGYQYDKETGLYYLNARMYDPVTARFMQEDTYAGQQRDPLSLNLYTYCHNSPLMYFDPTGHYTEYSYETRGYYEYHGYLLSMDSANDNLAEREMRKAMWKEFPGKTASSPADLAMINAGYGDAFKHPTMVYKKVRIAREVKADHTNSRTFQEYAYEKQQNAKTNAAKQMRSQFDGNEAALEVIDSGIEQFNTAYGYYKPMIEEILILNGTEPTEENIASYSLQCFMADYLLVQIQDPESVKASLSGFGEYFVRGGYTESINNSKNPFVKYVLGTPVRLVDTAVKGAVGLYHSVENAGKAIGNYAWTNTSSNNTLVDFIQGDISWDEFNTRIAEDDKIRRSIMIGNCSGFADAVVGVVGGTLGSFQYIAYGETFYQDGTSALISAKDNAIVDTFDLSREDYMNGKSIATVEIVIATLVFALGKSMANTAAKDPASMARNWQGKGEYPGVDDWSNIQLKKGQKVWGGEPGQSNFYTTDSVMNIVGDDATQLYQGIQVGKGSYPQFRAGMTQYEVMQDMTVGYSKALANPQFGIGGFDQLFIPNYESVLQPILTRIMQNR